LASEPFDPTFGKFLQVLIAQLSCDGVSERPRTRVVDADACVAGRCSKPIVQ
jgi:hypothetical protein